MKNPKKYKIDLKILVNFFRIDFLKQIIDINAVVIPQKSGELRELQRVISKLHQFDKPGRARGFG